MSPAQQKLARLFETQAHYRGAGAARLRCGPAAVDAHAQRLPAGPAGRTARQARSDAEASADRLADEPSRPPMTARLAYGLTGIGRRAAHVLLTLQAAVDSTHAKAPCSAPPAGPWRGRGRIAIFTCLLEDLILCYNGDSWL